MNEEILKEQNFPAIGIDKKERDYLLDLIQNCKDIRDSEYGNSKNYELLQLSMRKLKKDLIQISGMLSGNSEKRSLEGYIYYIKDQVVFDLHIIRLCIEDSRKEYSTLDIFTPKENGINVVSSYSGLNKKFEKVINTKGKVR